MFIFRTKYHPASGTQPPRIVASRASSRYTFRGIKENSQTAHIDAATELAKMIGIDPEAGSWARTAGGEENYVHHFHPRGA